MDSTSPGRHGTTRVTLCVTPRERFSCAVDSLRDIVRHTPAPFDLIYLDANSPPPVAVELARICAREGFTYLRRDEYLPPNRARNLALRQVGTPYVAFVDNDLFVAPGWLDALLHCAAETGAWAVTPVVLEGGRAMQIVHMAGGDYREERAGRFVRFHQRHRHIGMPLRSVRRHLSREPVDFFEFHCVLLRTDVFPRRDFLDEHFLAHLEHLDLAREIHAAGGSVFLEPDALVRYDNARPFKPYDRAFFELRWGEEWCRQSTERARQKWQLAPDDPALERLARWTAQHRHLMDRTRQPWILRAVPRALARAAARRLGLRGRPQAGVND